MDSYLCIKQGSTESIKSSHERRVKHSNFFNMSFLSFRAKSILQNKKDFGEITTSILAHNSSLSYKIFSGLKSIIHKEMLVLSIVISQIPIRKLQPRKEVCKIAKFYFIYPLVFFGIHENIQNLKQNLDCLRGDIDILDFA